jgi:lysophospholipase L1-like esterase
MLLALGVVGCGPSAPSPTGATPVSPSPTAAPAQQRIALLGDGLIDGNGLPDDQCLACVLAGNRQDLLVLDLGLGHDSSARVLTRFRDATEQHLDAAVIWVGTYDAAAGLSPEQYGSNMGRLLDAFKGTRVILLPPITLQGGHDAAPYVAALQSVAAQHGTAVTDIASVINGADWQSGGEDLGPNADASLAALLSTTLAPAAASPSASPPRKRVVLIGDSLTYGSGLEPPQDLPSAVRALRPDLDVIATAVGGQESGDVLGRARQFRLLHAAVAVIWIGGQDADDGVPVSSFRDNVTRLVAALKPVTVFLVPPIADYAVSATGYVPFAAATRDLAAQLGAGLIDVGTYPRSAYQDDATHLDASSEAQVASLYAKAL